MGVSVTGRMLLTFAVMSGGFAALPSPSGAQSDEIQVYDGSLAARGVFNLTLHNNFTPRGAKTPGFAGGVTPDRSFNGVPELALGVTDWLEAGLYLPLYTRDTKLGFGIDGAKLRLLFATPHGDDRAFVYGANFEFSVNAKRWDTHRVTSEVRGILGWHLNPRFDVIVNPIFDTAYDGTANLDFAPSVRVAYKTSKAWSVAAETYSDFGAIKRFSAASAQSHQLFGVVDHVTKRGLEMEFGAGVGLTGASDRLTLKLIVSKDLTGGGR
jgi:hypothetical protein